MIFVSLLFQLFDCYCGCILIPGGAWVLIDLKTCLKAQQGSQVFTSKNQILFVFVSLSSCLFFFNVCARLYQCVICTLCISLSVSLFLSTVNKKLDGIVTWNIYIYIYIPCAKNRYQSTSKMHKTIGTGVFSAILGFHRKKCASDQKASDVQQR